MSESVIPNAIRLGDSKPVGVAAHRRSAVHMSTTQNRFGPGTIARLPIETGGHGIWADVSRTGRLEFDIKVINKNPYADFTSLGRAGFQNVIEEIQLEVNGVPIEINRQYGPTVELQMIRRGQNPDPFYHTFANKYSVPEAGRYHCNLVKPCMVNANGQPWDYRADNYLTSVTVPQPSLAYTFNTVGTTAAITYSGADGAGNDARQAYMINHNGVNAGDQTSAIYAAEPFTTARGAIAKTAGTLLIPNQALNLLGPLRLGRDWDELKKDVKANLTTRNNLKDCSMFYSQAKYLPIMCKPTKQDAQTYMGGVFGVGNVPEVLSWDNCEISYHVSMPLEMGVMGTLNPSAIPSFMFGAGRTSMVIKFAAAAHVFQTTLDPNRVVPGTMRGYVPFKGGRATVLPPALANGQTQAAFSPAIHPFLAAAIATIREGQGAGTALPSQPEFPTVALAAGQVTQLIDSETPAGNVAGQQTIGTSTFSPIPQYVLGGAGASNAASMQEAWITARPYSKESQACFGTWKPFGVPQTRRSNLGALPLLVPQTHYGDLTYEISGLMYRVEEILMNDQVTASVLSAAMGGKAVLGTTILKEMKQQTVVNASQKILAPFTGANVADVCFAFRHPDQLDYTGAFAHPTYSFVNPFASVKKSASTFTSGNTTHSFQVGTDTPSDYTIEHAFDTTLNSNVEIYAQLASEHLPRHHIRSVDHLVEFVTAGDQIFTGSSDVGGYRRIGGMPNQHDCNYSLTNPSANAIERQGISCLEDGFFAAHLPMNCLDDQTITGNPFLVRAASAAYLPGGNGLALVRERGNYFLPHTEPLQGTFHLSFNLETFQGLGDKLRSGTTIVNNQFFLLFENAKLCAETTLEMLVVARCYAKIVFERGGGVQVIS